MEMQNNYEWNWYFKKVSILCDKGKIRTMLSSTTYTVAWQ